MCEIQAAVDEAVNKIFDLHKLHLRVHKALHQGQIFAVDFLRAHDNLAGEITRAGWLAAEMDTVEEVERHYSDLAQRIVEQIKELAEISYGNESYRLESIRAPYRRIVEKRLNHYITPASAIPMGSIEYFVEDIFDYWHPLIEHDGLDVDDFGKTLDVWLEGLELYRNLVNGASENLRETAAFLSRQAATRYAGLAVLVAAISSALTAAALYLTYLNSTPSDHPAAATDQSITESR